MRTNEGLWAEGGRARATDRVARVVLVVAAFALASPTFGCAGDDPHEIRPYTDSAGRSCNVDVADISSTATCDADPSALITCDTGQEASFVLSDDYDVDTTIWTLESCAGCIDRAAHQTFIGGTTCASVECDTDVDCVHDNYHCTSGFCRHM